MRPCVTEFARGQYPWTGKKACDMSFNIGNFKTEILLMEICFKLWDLLWKQKSCGQWMLSDMEVLDVGGIWTGDHHGLRANDKYDSLKWRDQL